MAKRMSKEERNYRELAAGLDEAMESNRRIHEQFLRDFAPYAAEWRARGD